LSPIATILGTLPTQGPSLGEQNSLLVAYRG